MTERKSALVCVDCRQPVVKLGQGYNMEPGYWEHVLDHDLADHDAKPTWGYANERRDIK